MTLADSTSVMDTLTTLLQSLPQEIYNEIYDLTFTSISDTRIINKAYRPPNCLCVGRHTREVFGKSCYGGGGSFLVDIHDMARWLYFLEPKQREMLSSIHVTNASIVVPMSVQADGQMSSLRWLARDYLHRVDHFAGQVRDVDEAFDADTVSCASVKLKVGFEGSSMEEWVAWPEQRQVIERFFSKPKNLDGEGDVVNGKGDQQSN